jgi:hypothetical protein
MKIKKEEQVKEEKKMKEEKRRFISDRFQTETTC